MKRYFLLLVGNLVLAVAYFVSGRFGLSLAFDFDVYLADESIGAGDASFRKKARAAFRKRADHASLIMVSHAEATLRQFCTAGIWLDGGKAHWFDDIEDALKAYSESLPQ